jgi:small neutral amino acid transporter SnatA (MarC family)
VKISENCQKIPNLFVEIFCVVNSTDFAKIFIEFRQNFDIQEKKKLMEKLHPTLFVVHRRTFMKAGQAGDI